MMTCDVLAFLHLHALSSLVMLSMHPTVAPSKLPSYMYLYQCTSIHRALSVGIQHTLQLMCSYIVYNIHMKIETSELVDPVQTPSAAGSTSKEYEQQSDVG